MEELNQLPRAMYPGSRAELDTEAWRYGKRSQSPTRQAWAPQSSKQATAWGCGSDNGSRQRKLAHGFAPRSHLGIQQCGADGRSEKLTDHEELPPPSGRGTDEQAAQHQSLRGVLKYSSAQPAHKEGRRPHRACTVGCKLRTAAGTSGLSLVIQETEPSKISPAFTIACVFFN